MDETQPLLSPTPSKGHVPGDIDDALFNDVIDFNPDGDEENPMEWPDTYKRGVIMLLAFMAFTVTFTCMGVVPVAGKIVLDLEGQESKSASVLLVTIWELGEAAGPLLIAPLSEVYGRYAVFNAANVLFIFWTIVAAWSHDSRLFILARFMTGCAVASNVLNPAIIGDMLPPEKRGSAMATLMLAPLLGGAIGPAIAGAVAQSLGWRQVLWGAALIAGVCELAFLLLLRETYKISILKRRVSRLRKQTSDIALKAAFNAENESTAIAVWRSIKRPAAVISGSFVLQILSLYGAVMFAFFYIMSTSLPSILDDVYGFPPASTGSAFMSFSVGSAFGIVLCNMSLDRIYVKLKARNNGNAEPEHRMPLIILSAFFLPATVALYGWTAHNHWPIPLLLLAVGLLGFFLVIGMVPQMAYVVDAFGLYSASALTALLVTRCLMGTFLPLVVAPLVDAFGYGFGFLVLAALCLVVTPIPLVVMRYGTRWRQRSTYTKDS